MTTDDDTMSEEEAAAYDLAERSDPEVMEALSTIAERFPSLRGAPGVRPFNIETLVGWGLDVERQHLASNADGQMSGVMAFASMMMAILLLCRLLNYRDKRPVLGESMLNESHSQFDIYCAISWWNDGDRAAFAEWVRSGVLPLSIRWNREHGIQATPNRRAN